MIDALISFMIVAGLFMLIAGIGWMVVSLFHNDDDVYRGY